MRRSLSAILSHLWGYTRELWVRSVLIGGLALVAAGASQWAHPFVPERMSGVVSPEAVDRLLDIIATSMLAVTTFSLTVMVTVHTAVSAQWTPRAHRLIISDGTTMTVLSTFVGAWIFSLAAIVLREAGFIHDRGIVVLFGMTLLVLVLIVVSLIGWIARLERLGSLAQVGTRLEQEACEAMERRMEQPFLGGRPFLEGRKGLPPAPHPVRAQRIGWVQSVEVEGLSGLASDHDTEIYLWVPIGRFVYDGDVVAYLDRAQAGLEDEVRRGIVIGDLRNYAQDPRFGLVVLGEVASKALSPGINDPGTAIEVIGRAARVLWLWRDEAAEAGDPPYPRLHVRPLDPRDLVEDVFFPIARDGRDKAAVQIHLQQALGSLARHPDPRMAAAALYAAEDAWRIAQAALNETDIARVAQAGGRDLDPDSPFRGLPSAFRDEATRREA